MPHRKRMVFFASFEMNQTTAAFAMLEVAVSQESLRIPELAVPSSMENTQFWKLTEMYTLLLHL